MHCILFFFSFKLCISQENIYQIFNIPLCQEEHSEEEWKSIDETTIFILFILFHDKKQKSLLRTKHTKLTKVILDFIKQD